MKTIEARAIISAKDATGAVFNAIAAKIAKLNSTAKAASGRANAAAARAETIGRAAGSRPIGPMAAGAARQLGGVGGAMLGVPGLGAAGGAVMAIKAQKRFAETDLALTRVGITADATDKQISDLDQTVRKTAFDTGNSFDKVTKGLESLVAGGLDLDKALPAIPAIAKTAQAAGAEVEDMATTTLALNQALGIGTDKMQSAFDVLVTGGKAGKFELKDMARYMASILPAAKAVGMQGQEGLEKIVALMQTVRAGTGTTEEAASSISNIFAKMESEETTKKFSKFGVDLREEMKKARAGGKDLLQTFIELTDKATKGDLSKVPQLFTDMEFARGMRALLQYRDVYTDVMSRVKSSTGSTMTDFDRVMKRPQMAINRLSESWDRFVAGLGKGLDGIGTSSALNKLGELMEKGAEYRALPSEEREKVDAERRRREAIDPQIDQLDAQIAQREKDGAPATGALGAAQRAMDRLRGRVPATSETWQKELEDWRLKRWALQQSRDTPDAQGRTLFSDDEVKAWKDAEDRKNAAQAFLARGGMPRPSREEMARKRVSATMGWDRSTPPGSAGEGNSLDLPYQGGGEPDRRAQDVKVSGEMNGKTEVVVKFEAGTSLVALDENVRSALAEMKGLIRQGNGPGSTGRSSPDAAAPTGLGGR